MHAEAVEEAVARVEPARRLHLVAGEEVPRVAAPREQRGERLLARAQLAPQLVDADRRELVGMLDRERLQASLHILLETVKRSGRTP
jgi:hypothetical protein